MNRTLIFFLFLCSILPESILAQASRKTSLRDQTRRHRFQHDSSDRDFNPKIVVSDTHRDFGEVLINNLHYWEFTINNSGSDTLIIQDLQNRNPVFLVNNTTRFIPENSGLDIKITFSPKKVGSYIDTLMIYSNDPDGSILKVILKGTGVLPTQEEILVSVLPDPFTPNGDGFNDYVEFSFSEHYNREPVIQIFSLRGEKICELDGLTGNAYRWNGKDSNGNDVEPGVYIYILRLEDNQTSNGTITLIR